MMKPGSRDVLLLLTSMVLASVPVGYLQVVLPLYLNRAGLEPSLIGLLYSLSGLVTAGLVAFSGTLADRFGRRGFLIWVRHCRSAATSSSPRPPIRGGSCWPV